ncbi:heparin cofactor 2 [Conger conger]|nr:heparin cofactor 2 [Conger conger]
MWFLVVAAVSCLLLPSSHGGVKGLKEHFEDPAGAKAVDPRSRAEGGEVDVEAVPLDFHKENTVTSVLPAEGLEDEDLEDEDYIDFDKILAGEEDDYGDGDKIDEIATPAPEVDIFAEPSDPKVRRARLLRLFHGQTRIQRLNIVNANFGFNLYRSLRNDFNQTDNILLAPAGISIAMGMMDLGTGPETHRQLYRALGFADFVNASAHYDDQTVHKLFRKLSHRLYRRNFGYTLRSVSDLYVKRDIPVSDGFRTEAKNYYFAEPQSVDFQDSAFLEKANRRIEKLTKGLIKEPLKSVDPNMVLMLLNYLYFKGTWEQKFPKDATFSQNFRVTEKYSVRVPMMQNRGSFMAAADHELQCDVVQLPYVGNVSMLVVVPRKLSGMRKLEQDISATVVSKWISNMTNRTRVVVFPKFKLEKNYDLIANMKELGLKDLFEETGDFSRLSSEKLTVNWLKHQGTITVNEEGTEAAALTQVGFMPLSTQTRFVVDRPFLFLIYEHRTNCLVFMGRVVDPSQN